MRSRGFTLVEMMVVLLIAGIVLAAGVPALQDFAAEQQLISAGNAFFHSASLTRSEAIRRGRPASMSPNDGHDWSSGWKIEAGERLVMMQSPLPPGISVSYRAGGELVGYRANGTPLKSSSWYFSSHGKTRAVVINFLGRVRVCNPVSDKSCARGEED
ncbi:GspH/FimT family pseudopilin [Herbaspirillum robiniae]|uniref:Type II secretion system protein H n=1 Tax=Herbaspirillum robiniae TaxID=2014887 RepID=A0ABX2M3H3_9BURK|nr:GspH/FimT family pseudopilin [Herbaspirillum robiniae]NUU04559.1 prepilin-type N-terminal cleavage/methylation domain-containing protein [Herbaspirillum robiniae]